ncbi:protein kinase family protein [Streptomyces sp. SID2563]|uniref:protein kinase family protein n=1 Tax=Streptomyces sp. SID2563 TaxID=2690255 RepID=UPI001371F6A3|nr:protein kinase family protein [Streptomyces sp. SID2563]MYW08175.1 protein kinase family protein [Streptomyces sp. SID2563]
MGQKPDGGRAAVHAAVATRLALLSDRRLGREVAAATPLSSGLGGRAAELDVDGTRVFVKRVPLTDLELRPEHVRSTANLFGLPLFYQYGIGSAGFGAWRELAAHILTTRWVLDGAHPDFPLMYHWRVLPDTPPQGYMDALGGIEGAVAHWEGHPAVRARLEAIGRSTASLVLFLEHVPHTLGSWLADRRAAAARGGEAPPYARIDAALTRGADFMSTQGFVHFDAHFRNVLTDGRSIRFADFGLALSTAFELSAEESAFLAAHRAYDRHYVAGDLLRHHLSDEVYDAAFLRAWLAGTRPAAVPPEAAALLDRHAPAALALDAFHHSLLKESRRTPYPAAAIDEAAGR